MTAVVKFILEPAGVLIIDVPQEKEPGLVSSIAKVQAPSAFIFPNCFMPQLAQSAHLQIDSSKKQTAPPTVAEPAFLLFFFSKGLQGLRLLLLLFLTT